LKNNVLSLDPIYSSSGVQDLDRLIMSMISKDVNNRPSLSYIRDVLEALVSIFSDKEC
jgi:hypothetical protein